MESVTFNIENQSISYHVNLLGVETVKVNDTQVSKKLSLPKSKHKFVLNVYGKDETFFIKSKQQFSSGDIIVQLFHNEILIEEKVLKISFGVTNDNTHTPNSTLLTGIMFIIFSLIFDWSKFFLLIGLFFVLSSCFNSTAKPNTSDELNSSETSD